MYKYKRYIVGGIALLLVVIMVVGLVIHAFGASSSEIKDELSELKEQADEIEAKQKELQAQIQANNNKEVNLVDQKLQIDQTMELLQQEIDNKNQQIKEYNLLISAKQNELDDAIGEKEALDAKYKARVRSMEEDGKVSYWGILFNAHSFSDLLDRIDMINEIAGADNRMLQQLQDAAQEIENSREALAAEKVTLEEIKVALAAKEEELTAQRKESDRVLTELIANGEQLAAAAAEYDAMEEALAQDIAAKEAEYTEALRKEEAARQQALAAQQAAAGNSGGGGGGSSGGFIRPVSGGYISCGYGYRVHPITGNYSFHTGIDYAVPYGSPIYASKSGTVTTAAYQNAWGNYVTINHGDGFSTLYAHMSTIAVSYGQYVSQGQVIGYVGSTGWSTGPHLHFTVYLNGQLVNPTNYVH